MHMLLYPEAEAKPLLSISCSCNHNLSTVDGGYGGVGTIFGEAHDGYSARRLSRDFQLDTNTIYPSGQIATRATESTYQTEHSLLYAVQPHPQFQL